METVTISLFNRPGGRTVKLWSISPEVQKVMSGATHITRLTLFQASRIVGSRTKLLRLKRRIFYQSPVYVSPRQKLKNGAQVVFSLGNGSNRKLGVQFHYYLVGSVKQILEIYRSLENGERMMFEQIP